MHTNYSGLAAAHELDVLLSHDDFEPAVEVDTIALDATIEALAAARELVARLALLQESLAAACTPETAAGLTLDVHVTADVLSDSLADVVVAGTYEVRGGVLL